MKRTLVIRLSALGDVAMLVPVLYSAARHYPGTIFYLLTKSPLLPIFEYRPENVVVIPVFTTKEHQGIFGLGRLIRQLATRNFDEVIDAHNVLRSQQVRMFFKLKGKPVSVINKGRQDKRALTRRHNKQLVPIKTSTERYHDAFKQLGYDFPLTFQSIFADKTRDFGLIEPIVGAKNCTWIGIAPFAKHEGKQYPLAKMEEVIRMLSVNHQTKIFLFGGGKEEKAQLETWAARYEHVVSVAGLFSFSSELLLMSYLQVMLTMDSGNMHLASLVATPVVSVWGATHPYAGFYGYGQHPDNIVEERQLSCRPCSVFGNKPCFWGDYACLERIAPEKIVEQINHVLSIS